MKKAYVGAYNGAHRLRHEAGSNYHSDKQPGEYRSDR
jgi:hypothetical protein